jgi:hypothetical protein
MGVWTEEIAAFTAAAPHTHGKVVHHSTVGSGAWRSFAFGDDRGDRAVCFGDRRGTHNNSCAVRFCFDEARIAVAAEAGNSGNY